MIPHRLLSSTVKEKTASPEKSESVVTEKPVSKEFAEASQNSSALSKNATNSPKRLTFSPMGTKISLAQTKNLQTRKNSRMSSLLSSSKFSRRSLLFKRHTSTPNKSNTWLESEDASELHLANDAQSTSSERNLQEAVLNLEKENELLRQNQSNISDDPNITNNALLRSINELLSSSSFKVAASSVGHCLPADGVNLHITDWEVWRKRYESWLEVNQIKSPKLRQHYFIILSGPHLYGMLETAPKITGSTAEEYDLTVERLNGVFKAKANNFAQMREFRSMTQRNGENNVDYLSRLLRTALRIWERSDPMIDKEILLCMAVNSNDEKMQEFTMRLSTEDYAKQKYETLVDQARIIDDWRAVHKSNSAACSILAVESKSSYTPKNVYAGDRESSQNKYRGSTSYQPRHYDRNQQKLCHRCNSKNHLAYKCEHIHTTCKFCTIKGHTTEACRKLKRKTEQDYIEQSNKKQRTSVPDDNIKSCVDEVSANKV